MFTASILASSATYPMDGEMNDPALLEGLLTKQDINADGVITIIGFLSGVSTVGFSVISKGGSMLLALATVNPALFFSLFTTFTTGGLLYKAYMIIKLRRAVDKIGKDVEEIKVTVQNTNKKVTIIESDVLGLKRGQAEQTVILNRHGEKLQDVGDQVTYLQKQLDQHYENTDNRFNNIDEALQANEKGQDARDQERKQQFDEMKKNQDGQNEKLDVIQNHLERSLTNIGDEITGINTALERTKVNTNNTNISLNKMSKEMDSKFKRASLKLSSLQTELERQAEQYPVLAKNIHEKLEEQESQINELKRLFEEQQKRHREEREADRKLNADQQKRNEQQLALMQTQMKQGGQALQRGQNSMENKLNLILQQRQQNGMRRLLNSDPYPNVFPNNQQRERIGLVYYIPGSNSVNTGFFNVKDPLAITDVSEK